MNTQRTPESAETEHRPPLAGTTGLLAGAWLAYWTALPVATLWTPVRLFLRLKSDARAPTLSLSGDDGVRLQVAVDDVNMWNGAMSFGEIAAWVTIPPLLIWLLWFWWVGRSGRPASPHAVTSGEVAKLPLAEMPRQSQPADEESVTRDATQS